MKNISACLSHITDDWRTPSIYFIKGRLHYNDSIKPAPFPSILLIFQPIFDLTPRWFVFDKGIK